MKKGLYSFPKARLNLEFPSEKCMVWGHLLNKTIPN
jgi:hypothetical protein